MPPCVWKSLFGVIVLLAGPLAGWSGRAEAGFQLGRTASAGVERTRALLEGVPGANHEATTETAASAPATVPLPEPAQEPAPRRAPHQPHQATPHTGGNTSTSGGAPDGAPTAGGGMLLALLGDPLADTKAARGALFLAEQRFQLVSFPSRLFRPPRGGRA